MSIEPEFIGQTQPYIKHVAMPADSELCFAACVAAASGTALEEAQAGLLRAGLSQADGATNAPMSQTAVRVANEQGDRIVMVDPLETPWESSGETRIIMRRIFQQLQLRRPVAVLALHPREESEDFLHWTLLTGYVEDAGTTIQVGIMDPKASEITYEDPDSSGGLEGLIDRSLPMPGAYAYALQTIPILRPRAPEAPAP